MFDRHVDDFVRHLDDVAAFAEAGGERDVVGAVDQLKGRVNEWRRMHGVDRERAGLAIAALFRAQAEVAQTMFLWVSRRVRTR